MTKKEAKTLPNGLYLIMWKHSGGQSYAAVGHLHDGTAWMAPINWSSDKKDSASYRPERVIGRRRR